MLAVELTQPCQPSGESPTQLVTGNKTLSNYCQVQGSVSLPEACPVIKMGVLIDQNGCGSWAQPEIGVVCMNSVLKNWKMCTILPTDISWIATCVQLQLLSLTV